MKHVSRSIIALLLTLVMLLAAFPVTAMAAPRYSTADGTIYALKTGSVSISSGVKSDYYYSDGYFMEPDSYNTAENGYNPHLASLSMLLADAACTSKNSKAVSLLKAFGFAETNITSSDCFISGTSTSESLGYTMGVKPIKTAEGTETGSYLVAIALRGDNYNNEWISNFTLGSSGEAKGFSDARNALISALKAFLTAKGLDSAADSGKIRFWIAGYGRGGAVANLAGTTLVDTYVANKGANADKVFCYTFGTPRAGQSTSNTNPTLYAKSIFNLIHSYDPVTYVAPNVTNTNLNYNFIRYGTDRNITATAATSNTDWYSKLSAFDAKHAKDYSTDFHAAYFKLELPNPSNSRYQDEYLSFWPYTQTHDGDFYLTLDFAEMIWPFIQKSQKDQDIVMSDFISLYSTTANNPIGMTTYLGDAYANITNWIGARDAGYASKTVFTDNALTSTFGSDYNKVSRQQAVGVFIGAYFSMSEEQQDNLIECIQNVKDVLGISGDLSRSTLKSLLGTVLEYYRIIMAWNSGATDAQKAKTINYIWNLITDPKCCYTDKNGTTWTVQSVMNANIANDGIDWFSQLKAAFPNVIDTLLQVFNYDYYQSYGAGISVTSKPAYIICSVIYNLSTDSEHTDVGNCGDKASMTASHTTYVYLAAMETLDNFYNAIKPYLLYNITVNSKEQPTVAKTTALWCASYGDNGKFVSAVTTAVSDTDTTYSFPSAGTNWSLMYLDENGVPIRAARTNP